MKVDNAVILAAGTSSRFAPLSYEIPKALTEVKGEVLIERQIKQLREAKIANIYVVTGYKSEQLDYLRDNFHIQLIHNKEYLTRNNHASIWVARHVLGNSFICSGDNYFCENPFECDTDESYYAAEYAIDNTLEWCMSEDEDGYICDVRIGGKKAWYMMGHAFWSNRFSQNFLEILEHEYNFPGTSVKLWESIFKDHLDVLKMKIKKYPQHVIHEFDTLEELRSFDKSYQNDTRSTILKNIAERLGTTEEKIIDIQAIIRNGTTAKGFNFRCSGKRYQYLYDSHILHMID